MVKISFEFTCNYTDKDKACYYANYANLSLANSSHGATEPYLYYAFVARNLCKTYKFWTTFSYTNRYQYAADALQINSTKCSISKKPYRKYASYRTSITYFGMNNQSICDVGQNSYVAEAPATQ